MRKLSTAVLAVFLVGAMATVAMAWGQLSTSGHHYFMRPSVLDAQGNPVSGTQITNQTPGSYTNNGLTYVYHTGTPPSPAGANNTIGYYKATDEEGNVYIQELEYDNNAHPETGGKFRMTVFPADQSGPHQTTGFFRP